MIRLRLAPSAERMAISLRRAEYAGEDEVGNIGACDQEDEGHGSEHHQQCRTHVADEVFAE